MWVRQVLVRLFLQGLHLPPFWTFSRVQGLPSWSVGLMSRIMSQDISFLRTQRLKSYLSNTSKGRLQHLRYIIEINLWFSPLRFAASVPSQRIWMNCHHAITWTSGFIVQGIISFWDKEADWDLTCYERAFWFIGVKGIPLYVNISGRYMSTWDHYDHFGSSCHRTFIFDQCLFDQWQLHKPHWFHCSTPCCYWNQIECLKNVQAPNFRVFKRWSRAWWTQLALRLTSKLASQYGSQCAPLWVSIRGICHALQKI